VFCRYPALADARVAAWQHSGLFTSTATPRHRPRKRCVAGRQIWTVLPCERTLCAFLFLSGGGDTTRCFPPRWTGRHLGTRTVLRTRDAYRSTRPRPPHLPAWRAAHTSLITGEHCGTDMNGICSFFTLPGWRWMDTAHLCALASRACVAFAPAWFILPWTADGARIAVCATDAGVIQVACVGSESSTSNTRCHAHYNCVALPLHLCYAAPPLLRAHTPHATTTPTPPC